MLGVGPVAETSVVKSRHGTCHGSCTLEAHEYRQLDEGWIVADIRQQGKHKL